MKKLKPKNGDAQKKWFGSEVHVVSPERMEGSLWWERFVKQVGLEVGVKEKRDLWMVRVVSWQSEEMW